jgi:hypothetical protein
MVHHVSREATHLSAKVESPRSSCASSVSDQPEFPPRSLSLPPGNPDFLSSTGHQPLQRRSNSVSYPLSGTIADSVENMPAARRQSIDMTAIGFSPNSSQKSSAGSSSGLKDLDSMDDSPVPVSVASSKEHQHSMVSHIGLSRVVQAATPFRFNYNNFIAVCTLWVQGHENYSTNI